MISENELLRMYEELQSSQSQLLLDLKNIKDDDDTRKKELNLQQQITTITQLLVNILKLKKLIKNKMSL
jgi:hypothetical protein